VNKKVHVALGAVAAVLAGLGTAACSSRSASADAIGVKECDEYVAKVQSCLPRDPHMRAMEPAYKAQWDAWKQMVKTDRVAVEANCKAALESFRRSMPTCQ
jgi:hypothetical protein